MEPIEFSVNDLIINTRSRREVYRERKGEEKKAVHWGQRKLLLSEIEFFTIYLRKNMVGPICVYAGAAAGNHIPLLSSMFPSLTFHLYDPQKFHIKDTPRIKIYNDYFTNEIAESYKDKENVFFLSDIRTSDHITIYKESLRNVGIPFDDQGNAIGGDSKLIKQAKFQAAEKHSKNIENDMELQPKWVMLMNPLHALLKFKLPWSLKNENGDPIDRKVKYLKGIVYWQQWVGPTSTENRLKPVKNINGQYELEEWSILEYEQWCFYHNVVTRETDKYKNVLNGTEETLDGEELLNDYDSTAEIYILKMYLSAHVIDDDKYIFKISKLITTELNKYVKNPKTLSQYRQIIWTQDPVDKKRSNKSNKSLPNMNTISKSTRTRPTQREIFEI